MKNRRLRMEALLAPAASRDPDTPKTRARSARDYRAVRRAARRAQGKLGRPTPLAELRVQRTGYTPRTEAGNFYRYRAKRTDRPLAKAEN